jgi:hypothetical protein
LRDKENKLRDKENTIFNILLARETSRNRDENTAVQAPRRHPPTDNADDVLHIKLIAEAASRYAASSCHIPTASYTSMVREQFMEPKAISVMVDNMPEEAQLRQARQALMAARVGQIHPAKIHEKQDIKDRKYEFTVDEMFGVAMARYFSPELSCSAISFRRQCSLQELNAAIGPATPRSHSDGFVFTSLPVRASQDRLGSTEVENIGTACFEWKDSSFSPQEAIGQAFSEAANLTLSQYEFGVPSDQCLTALFSSNGRLCQFGFVSLIYPTCPALHMTSDILDLFSQAGLAEAARHLHNLRAFCIARDNMLRGLALKPKSDRDPNPHHFSPTFDTVALSLSKHFLKPVEKIFGRRQTKSASLLKQYHIFSHMYDMQYGHAVLPVAILCKQLVQLEYHKDDSLIFPRLARDFRMGFPSTMDDMKQYLSAIKTALKQLHKDCGIVHMDAYPTNIIWRKKTNEEIEIKIVDWDVASFISEPLDVNIIQAMMEKDALAPYYWGGFGATTADPRHDAWFVFIASLLTAEDLLEFDSLNNEAKRIITLHNSVIDRLYKENAQLTEEFEYWYEGLWSEPD